MALASSAVAKAQAVDPWHFSVTPYFWWQNLHGDVGVNGLAAHADLSQGDVSNALRFAMGGEIDARKQHYVIGLDASYLSFGGAPTDSAALRYSHKRLMTQPFGGLTIGGDWWAIDGIVGARIWNLHQMIVPADPRPVPTQADGRLWADGTVGARLFLLPVDFLRVNGGGDVGTGGSRFTWQAYGTIGVDPTSWLGLALTYRGLSADYSRRTFLYDANTQGLALSVGFRF